jgi:hypothetical protein
MVKMSDDDEEKGLLNLSRNKYFNKHRAAEIESFIRRSYYLCVILFFCLGITLVATVLAGVYKSSEITESILITVAGPVYLVLFLVLLCCGRHTILRMALVLVVTSFVGFLSGFICGANVKMVAMTLKDN